MFDVIVVGAGPGGALAAKKCAQQGLKTLLLEKGALPRDKVCSGLLVGPLAQNLVAQEFGPVPSRILSSPSYLKGFKVLVPGVAPATLENKMPVGWRKDIDNWMTEKAAAAGAQVRDSSRLTALTQIAQGYSVKVTHRGKVETIEATFVIGADGANSVTRKALFPEFKPAYLQALRECYRAEVPPGMDKDYMYLVVSGKRPPLYWCSHQKGDLFLVELATKMGEAKAMVEDAQEFMAREYGLDLEKKFVRRDACLEPLLHRDLLWGNFFPATGNALLIGDAGGFTMPVSGEGISTSLKTGLIAAASVAGAQKENVTAEKLYRQGTTELLDGLKKLYKVTKKIQEQANQGPEVLRDGVRDGWEESIKMW